MSKIEEAVAALRCQEVIVFPTETLYGLGADALDPTAVEQVYNLKGRDPTVPIPVIVADRAMLDSLTTDLTSLLAERLIAAFWPGPLTLVLQGRKELPAQLKNRTGGVGVRISSQPIATELVRKLGRPLTATSANPSGQPPARTIAEAKSYFTGKINVFVDGGPLGAQIGSTVVEVVDDKLRMIREGEISRQTLEQELGEVQWIS